MLILSVAGTVLYANLSLGLRSEDATVIRGKAEVVRGILARYPDQPEMLEEEVVLEPAVRIIQPYFARVLDPAVGTLYETPGMSEAIPSAAFLPPPASGAADPDPTTRHTPGGRIFLVLTVRATPEREGGRTIQVALDVTRDALILARQRRLLIALILLGVAISGTAGYLTARRGLRPLARITEATQRVTAAQLDQRIGTHPWPAELAELAAVFDGMMKRLEDSFDRLSSFSANLAHELRTPLTNLRGEAEVALSRSRTEDEYREVLESALEEYDRLTRLIDRLLFLARADAGAADLERRRLSARDEMEAVRDYYASVADERGVALLCRGQADVVADPMLLRRALGNLVANALEHTPAGGEVTLSACGDSDGVRFVVADTGHGIDEADVPHVFERFYRSTDGGGTASGTGLGLPLVASIARLHGGWASLSGTPDKGTSVTLFLPRTSTGPTRDMTAL